MRWCNWVSLNRYTTAVGSPHTLTHIEGVPQDQSVWNDIFNYYMPSVLPSWSSFGVAWQPFMNTSLGAVSNTDMPFHPVEDWFPSDFSPLDWPSNVQLPCYVTLHNVVLDRSDTYDPGSDSYNRGYEWYLIAPATWGISLSSSNLYHLAPQISQSQPVYMYIRPYVEINLHTSPVSSVDFERKTRKKGGKCAGNDAQSWSFLITADRYWLQSGEHSGYSGWVAYILDDAAAKVAREWLGYYPTAANDSPFSTFLGLADNWTGGNSEIFHYVEIARVDEMDYLLEHDVSGNNKVPFLDMGHVNYPDLDPLQMIVPEISFSFSASGPSTPDHNSSNPYSALGHPSREYNADVGWIECYSPSVEWPLWGPSSPWKRSP